MQLPACLTLGTPFPGFGARGELDAYADQAFSSARPRDGPRHAAEQAPPTALPRSERGQHNARSAHEIIRQPAPKRAAAGGAGSCTSDSGSYVSFASQGADSAHSDGSSPDEAGDVSAAPPKGSHRALLSGRGFGYRDMRTLNRRHRDPDQKERAGVRCPGGNSAGEPQPWPAYLALRAWRESARECHLYTYAPPNRCAWDSLNPNPETVGKLLFNAYAPPNRCA